MSNSASKVWLYGAGGHAYVVTDILNELAIPVGGLFDDDPKVVSSNSDEIREGVGLLGENFERPPEPMIITVGNCEIRNRLAASLGSPFFTAVHPSARLSTSVEVGEGTVVLHGAIVQAKSQIGRHVIVNTGARIDHENVLSDFVHVAPGATLCGDVSVGNGSFIGAGAVLIQGIRVGAHCTIGAGAVIIRDVPDYAVVVGNPGRAIKYNRSIESHSES